MRELTRVGTTLYGITQITIEFANVIEKELKLLNNALTYPDFKRTIEVLAPDVCVFRPLWKTHLIERSASMLPMLRIRLNVYFDFTAFLTVGPRLRGDDASVA